MATVSKIILTTIFFGLVSLFPPPTFATTSIKPDLFWQRSLENSSTVVYEYVTGTRLTDALALPLDPTQPVWDDGTDTPLTAKIQVLPGVSWASWRQYSSDGWSCQPVSELRHFRATFNISSGQLGTTGKLILRSSYYVSVGNVLPINDNIYVYLNNHRLITKGTSYPGTTDFLGTAHETDGIVIDGDLGTSGFGFLQTGTNTLDVVAGERCAWGGMGRLEVVVETDAPITQAISLDVKPGTRVNSINPQNKGVIPAAILTTPSFNAKGIDPLSVRFGPGQAKEIHNKGHLEDVDGDGDTDLVLHFKTQDTGIKNTDTQLCLDGKTMSGFLISGCDQINVVPQP